MVFHSWTDQYQNARALNSSEQFFLLVALLSVSLFLSHFLHTDKKRKIKNSTEKKNCSKFSAPVYMYGKKNWAWDIGQWVLVAKIQRIYTISQIRKCVSCHTIMHAYHLICKHSTSALCTLDIQWLILHASLMCTTDITKDVVWGNFNFFCKHFISALFRFNWFILLIQVLKIFVPKTFSSILQTPNHSRFIWWRRSTDEQQFCNQFCF